MYDLNWSNVEVVKIHEMVAELDKEGDANFHSGYQIVNARHCDEPHSIFFVQIILLAWLSGSDLFALSDMMSN